GPSRPSPLPSRFPPYTTLFRSQDEQAPVPDEDPEPLRILPESRGAGRRRALPPVDMAHHPHDDQREEQARGHDDEEGAAPVERGDRKSTRLNSSHQISSDAVFR